MLNGMHTESRSRNRYPMLSVWFHDDFSCNSNRCGKLLDMFAKFVLADQCGFLRQCRLLMLVSGQDGYVAKKSWIDIAIGWEYTQKEFVDERGTEEHTDG